MEERPASAGLPRSEASSAQPASSSGSSIRTGAGRCLELRHAPDLSYAPGPRRHDDALEAGRQDGCSGRVRLRVTDVWSRTIVAVLVLDIGLIGWAIVSALVPN